MSNKTKIVLGLVGATAVGVAIGLLLAPEKGTETRKKIADTAGEWADQLTDLFANAKGELENLRKKSEKIAGKAGKAYSNVKESYS
ncbi:MAG: YtxH domain-containing protein [Candidatus Dadabacteria bacterium]